MNTINDTLGTLAAPVRALMESVMEVSRKNFNEDHGVSPVGFLIPPGVEAPVVIEIPIFDDETKPGVWAMLRMVRRNCKTVAFLSEVWMSQPKPGDGLWEGGECRIMPRDDPNHTEAVMLQLWEGSRAITFRALITRNPDQMGAWETYFDSSFPKDGMSKAGGAMMEGEPCAQEGN